MEEVTLEKYEIKLYFFQGTSFFPKKAVDVNKCEVMRAAKLEENALTFVSFVAPRKS